MLRQLSSGSLLQAVGTRSFRIEKRWMQISVVTIPTEDGTKLGGTLYRSDNKRGTIVLSSATAVPQGFYKHFARYLAEARGYDVLTFDYRGIGDSRHGKSLRGFNATVTDWAFYDLPAAVQFAVDSRSSSDPDDSKRVYLVGHSVGGHIAGMLSSELSCRIEAMVTISSQSGYWNLQGGDERYKVFFHVHLTLPLLSSVFGFMPWSWFTRGAQNLPAGVAQQWAKWCRSPGYLLDDPSLPLYRFANFKAPVLAYSIEDDKWGTARSVDAFMLSAYPNVERRHLNPAVLPVDRLGHFGFFQETSVALWDEPVEWLEAASRKEEDGRNDHVAVEILA